MVKLIRNKINTNDHHFGIMIYVLEIRDIRTGTILDQKFYFTRKQAEKIFNKKLADHDKESDVSYYGGETLWLW